MDGKTQMELGTFWIQFRNFPVSYCFLAPKMFTNLVLQASQAGCLLILPGTTCTIFRFFHLDSWMVLVSRFQDLNGNTFGIFFPELCCGPLWKGFALSPSLPPCWQMLGLMLWSFPPSPHFAAQFFAIFQWIYFLHCFSVLFSFEKSYTVVHHGRINSSPPPVDKCWDLCSCPNPIGQPNILPTILCYFCPHSGFNFLIANQFCFLLVIILL